MKFGKLVLCLGTAAGLAFAAQAQTPVSVGATIYDTAGAVVGTVEAISGDVATVSTGNNKVGLPLSAFGTSGKGPVIAMTRAQLDAAAEDVKAKAEAQLKAQLAPGSTVYDTAGDPVGAIDTSDAEFVTLTVDTHKVKIPANAFTQGEKGAMIGMTAAQVKAAAAAGAAQSATPPAN